MTWIHVLDDKIKIAHAKDCKRAVNLDEKFGGGSAEHNSFRGAGAVELPGAGLGVLNYPLYVELLAKHHPNIPIIIEHIDESDIPRAKKFVDDTLKKMEKSTDITEDERKEGEEKIQKMTDKYVAKIDKSVENKSKEIMTV